jgi:thiol-disulfide isomerase/thioredoxin
LAAGATAVAGALVIAIAWSPGSRVALQAQWHIGGGAEADRRAVPLRPVGNLAFTAPKPLRDLAFVDGEGRSMSLAAFRGKVVLLNVWATWCVPCREEMPTLDRLQAALGGPDFQVVALSIDRGGAAPVREFYRAVGVEHLAVYVDSAGRTGGAIGAPGIPVTLVLDRAGREIARTLGAAAWDGADALAALRHVIEDDATHPEPAPRQAAPRVG